MRDEAQLEPFGTERAYEPPALVELGSVLELAKGDRQVPFPEIEVGVDGS